MTITSFLVSIITPSYNSAQFIAETIDAVLAQTYTNWELLITDDCSTDNTIEIVQSYIQKDSRIKLFQSEKNSGAGVARNNSIKEAKGRFIAFCDADDVWSSDKLEKQISFMIEKDVAFSYGNYDIIDEVGKITGRRVLRDKVSYSDMLLNNYIGTLTAMYDTEKVGKNYMESVRNRQDWVLWLAILKKTDWAFNVSQKIGFYRISNNSISRNKMKMMKYNWLVYRKYEKFSFVKSCYYIIRYVFMYLKKVNL